MMKCFFITNPIFCSIAWVCLSFCTSAAFSMEPSLVFDQSIPHCDETSETIIPFSTTRYRGNGALKKELFLRIKETFDVDVFIETGTYIGDTSWGAADVFSEVHTIELSQELYEKALQRFASRKNVFPHLGDSSHVLGNILPSIDKRILFYLDGHYSGYETAHSGINTPILMELLSIAISKHNQSVILIDDIRLFQNSLYPDKIRNTCLDGYPDLRLIVEILQEINPTYQICFLGDALLAFPRDATISVTPLMRACAISRLSISFPEFPESAIESAHEVIANASEMERLQLLDYYDTFSDFEMTYGFRSFSALWYGLVLWQNGEQDKAIDCVRRACKKSLPDWGAQAVLQKIINHPQKNSLESSTSIFESEKNKNLQLLATALSLNYEALVLFQNLLNSYEFSFYESEGYFLSEFPFAQYRAISVQTQGTFFINGIDDSIKNQLRNNIPWETENKNIIEKHVKAGTIALDIGSHIGTHTLTMAKCVGENGTVFAFEPNKIIYRELCYNLAINQCLNVLPMRCAIGKNKCLIEVVTSHPQNEGGSYVVDRKSGENSAILLPLDAFNLDNVSFIKIDVENMEADVLDGAVLTILRNRPVMLIEVQGNGERPWQLNENSQEMAKISMNKIKNLGYKLEQVGGSCDYLATPLH